MKTTRMPAPIQGSRQLNLLLEPSHLAGFSLLDRSKARVVLAQILMQAAGLSVEELDDDKH